MRRFEANSANFPVRYYLKKQNKILEEEEQQGSVGQSQIAGSKAGHGGEAVVAFRYVH